MAKKMISRLSVLAVLIVFLAACSKTVEYTNIIPADATVVTSINLKSLASNAELALLGCYGYMTTTGAYGQMWQELPIIASGFAFGQRTASTAISLEAVPSDEIGRASCRERV